MDEEVDALLAALDRVDWVEASQAEPMEGWSNLRQFAESEGRGPEEARALLLVAAAIGLILRGSDWESPYTPLMSMEGRRTHLPADFTPLELRFFERLLPQLPPSQLSARIADILHLRASERSDRYRWAKEAVERWAKAGISRDLSRSEQEDWQRAADIAARFHMEVLKDELIAAILDVFRHGDASTALSAARAMRSARYFPEAEEVARRLEELGDGQAEGHFERMLYGESIRWTRGADDKGRAGLHAKVGDSWWKEAESRRADSRMVARDFFGNALVAYRASASRHRSQHVIDRIGVLPEVIRIEGDAALAEMVPMEGESIDLSDLIESARSIAQIEDSLDALATWFDNVRMDSFASARTDAQKQMSEHPLLHMLSRTTVDRDGRTVHRSSDDRERMGVSDDEWSTMMRSFMMKSSLVTSGYIWPALREFSTYRRLTLGDFELFVECSPFVAQSARGLYALGLWHGYYERFAEAIHLLAPVTEACVRDLLQRGGVETRMIRQDDTEIEPGLSALIDIPGADDVLGPDLMWNIRALYCDPLGSNLRNRVAHGLIPSDEANSAAMLSAWWLAFRLAFVPYYNALRAEVVPAARQDGQTDPAP